MFWFPPNLRFYKLRFFYCSTKNHLVSEFCYIFRTKVNWVDAVFWKVPTIPNYLFRQFHLVKCTEINYSTCLLHPIPTFHQCFRKTWLLAVPGDHSNCRLAPVHYLQSTKWPHALLQEYPCASFVIQLSGHLENCNLEIFLTDTKRLKHYLWMKQVSVYCSFPGNTPFTAVFNEQFYGSETFRHFENIFVGRALYEKLLCA